MEEGGIDAGEGKKQNKTSSTLYPGLHTPE